ncbi:MAG: alpha-mannosidase [Cytophagales bacterium]|nr:alpha-mannosidase [Armatimonadota bacterium]
MLFFVKQRAALRIKDIEAAICRERVPLTDLRFASENQSPAAGLSADTTDWLAVSVGHGWHGAESAAWLRGQFSIPAEWAGERVGLYLAIEGCEPLLYLDGRPAQALDYNHPDVLLYDAARGGETHTIAVECYSQTRGSDARLTAAELVRIDRDAYVLFYDFAVALEALDVLDENSREYQGLLHGLESAMNALDYTAQDDTETILTGWHSFSRSNRSAAFYASLPAARAALRREFYDKFPADTAREPAMTLAGHAHIDVAWLWSLANTRKKCGRTFATALRLMEEFPDYHFTQSQPQLYQYTKEDYPELYERIKQRVAEGRWELTGGMWVEADCNVTSGESLIRQILLGNRFFQREFGKTTRVLWLPDVFGYSAALPQIVKGCGMGYFLTTKISWSQFNRMPCDTFQWRGIDGTEVLTHFVTTSKPEDSPYTYNGFVTAKEMRGSWQRYQQKDVNDELLNLFGYGDGGGGADRRMLEAGRRYQSLAGFSRASFGPAESFFDRLAKRVEGSPLLPTWVGELYLEFHRGTYTSQARNKKANRQSEILYRNAELFGVLATLTTGHVYPWEALNRGWEKILLNQFHDIIPGSSIAQVYEDSARDYAEITEIGETALQSALESIASRVRTRGRAVIVFNPTDTLRPSDVARITIPETLDANIEFADENGVPLAAQKLSDREYLTIVPEVGPLGYQTLTIGKAGGLPEVSSVSAREGAVAPLLENDFVRVTFDEAGEIVSLVHKLYEDAEPGEEGAMTEREVIAPGQRGNALILFEDKPLRYDAWDIDIYYQSKPYPLREIGTVERLTIVENGPVRAGIEIVRSFLRSRITQRVYLYAHSPRIEFETVIDWQERQMLLKTAFPVAVNASRATYEIQFGSVERPTHWNTSWDWARFEVCAHKWADLSEGDYGVSLLNDCKYGYDIRDNVLRLTLLKGAVSPDSGADLGQHSFTYALLPHTGDWRAETVDEAHSLNYPLLTRFVPANPRGGLPAAYAFATVDDQGLLIDTIKKAEDSDAIVIRLYEAFNTRGTATLTLGFPLAEAYTVNMVEENPEPIAQDGNRITFDYRPFEIKTFLLKPVR